jgi:hypothetical protein
VTVRRLFLPGQKVLIRQSTGVVGGEGERHLVTAEVKVGMMPRPLGQFGQHNVYAVQIYAFHPTFDFVTLAGGLRELMYRDKKIVVVMPAYNAAKTVRRTYDEVREQQLVDEIILVDDKSRDETVAVAQGLEGVRVHVHEANTGYGGNQKTCYRLALEAGADIVVMIHPDYQYTPQLIPAMVSMIASGLHPCVLGSHILGEHTYLIKFFGAKRLNPFSCCYSASWNGFLLCHWPANAFQGRPMKSKQQT